MNSQFSTFYREDNSQTSFRRSGQATIALNLHLVHAVRRKPKNPHSNKAVPEGVRRIRIESHPANQLVRWHDLFTAFRFDQGRGT